MIAELIQFFLRLIGLGKSKPEPDNVKIKKWENMRRQLLANQTSQRDELEYLKEAIRRIHDTILTKEKELNESSGEIRNIVEREVRQLFSDVEKSKGRQEILFRHLETNSTTIARIEELIQGLKSPTIQEDVIDVLIGELEELFSKLKDEDGLLRELKQVQYHAPNAQPVDIDKRLAEFHEENPNLEKVSSQKTPPVKIKETEPPRNMETLME